MKITKDIYLASKGAAKEIITEMEKHEDWVVKNPEIMDKIDNIVNTLTEILKQKDVKATDFIRVLAYLNTGNAVEILHRIEDKDKKFLEKIIETVNALEEDVNTTTKHSKLLTERLAVIYRIQSLPKIFSAERLSALENTIKTISE